MSKIYQSVTELIGGTPLLEIKRYEARHDIPAQILAKLEFLNPNQSVKDRTALSLIEDAEERGVLHPGDTIVETTSGNTGIGLAAIAAVKGYKFRVYIQDQVSRERSQVIEALGGEVVKLSQVPVIAKTMEETGGDFIAAVKALKEEVLSKEEGIVFVDQLSNPANPLVHERTTGPEIWEDTDGKVDILVAGVGTGGTISGTGKYLKEKNPAIKIVAVQPGPDSRPGPDNATPDEIDGIHPFEEVPKSWVPDTMDTEIYDEYINVEAKDAYRVARELAKTEGILVGSSSGAAVYAAEKIALRPENKGKRIVVIIPDTGLRYLSTKLFEKE